MRLTGRAADASSSVSSTTVTVIGDLSLGSPLPKPRMRHILLGAGAGRGGGLSGARWASELRGRASAYGCRVAHRACRPTPARRNILHPHRYLLIWSVALFRAPPPGLETPYQPGAAPHHAALLRPQVKCGGVAGAREAAEVETESGRCDSCAAYKDSVV